MAPKFKMVSGNVLPPENKLTVHGLFQKSSGSRSWHFVSRLTHTRKAKPTQSDRGKHAMKAPPMMSPCQRNSSVQKIEISKALLMLTTWYHRYHIPELQIVQISKAMLSLVGAWKSSWVLCAKLCVQSLCRKKRKWNFDDKFQAQLLRNRAAKQAWIGFKQALSVAWTHCVIRVQNGRWVRRWAIPEWHGNLKLGVKWEGALAQNFTLVSHHIPLLLTQRHAHLLFLIFCCQLW